MTCPLSLTAMAQNVPEGPAAGMFWLRETIQVDQKRLEGLWVFFFRLSGRVSFLLCGIIR